MKKCFSILFSLAMLFVFTGQYAFASALDEFKGQKGEIAIAGGTAHIPVMEAAAKNIMTANPDIRITVAGGGSGVGIQKVGEGPGGYRQFRTQGQ